MADIFNMADTWNDGATTFTSIKMNVTDTASDAASLLMDLQVGGASKFSVLADGKIGVDGSAPNTGRSIVASGTIQASNFRFNSNVGVLQWTDLVLVRDAANTLALRNSTNAQAFNIYNTYTDASNYERMAFKWDTNTADILTEAGASGTVRAMRIGSTSANTTIIAAQDGLSFTVGAGTFSFGRENVTTGALRVNGYFKPESLYLEEEATEPPVLSNTGVIFTEDDGSGKTRLMVKFGTGVAQQLAIEP